MYMSTIAEPEKTPLGTLSSINDPSRVLRVAVAGGVSTGVLSISEPNSSYSLTVTPPLTTATLRAMLDERTAGAASRDFVSEAVSVEMPPIEKNINRQSAVRTRGFPLLRDKVFDSLPSLCCGAFIVIQFASCRLRLGPTSGSSMTPSSGLN
jgi:hypothetical protein